MIHEGLNPSLLPACVVPVFTRCNLPGETTSLRFGVMPPFCGAGVPCKHVWATTLAADQHQYLTAAASADKLIWTWMLLASMVLMGRDYYDGDEELYEEDGAAPVLSSRSPAIRVESGKAETTGLAETTG